MSVLLRSMALVLLLAATAHAGGGEARAQAKAAYKAATELYRKGSYRMALKEFERAYEAVPDPSSLFNIAQCHRLLGDKQEALRYYLLFLDERPKAPNRAEVERYVAQLEADIAAEAPPPKQEAPAVALAPTPVPAPALAPVEAPPSPTPTPIYRTWWLWTAVAGVLVAGAVATALALTLQPAPSFQPTLPDIGPGAPHGTGMALHF